MAKRTRKTRSSGRSQAADYDEIVSKIKKVSELKTLLKMLVYGRSGTGKTTLVCHALPKPILLIDIKEEGSDSVIDVPGVDVVPATTWDDIEQLYWYLASGKSQAKDGSGPYKSVIIDTVSQAQERAQERVKEDEGKDFLSLQLRGKVSELMKTWLLNYRDLDMNVAFIAQDRVDEVDTEEEDQITPEVGPAVSPGIAKVLNAMVKMILQTYIQEVVKKKNGEISRVMEYRVRTGPHPYYITKVRKPKKFQVPAYIKDPTYEDLIALARGTYKTPEKAVSGKPKRPKK